MRIAFALLAVIHASIHLMGFAKAFDLAPLAALRMPISRPMGLVWIAAAVVILGAVAAWFAMPRWFWAAALAGLALSQVAIISSWSDARFGTIPNVLLALAAIHGAFAFGPFGLRAEYDRRVRQGIGSAARDPGPAVITEEDLAPLPPAVQRYLRFAGVVGTPRVQGFRARMAGRIRGSATSPWMPFRAEQHNFYDPPRRYFFLEATRGGLPVDGLHAYDAEGASMRIRLLSILPVVTVEGPRMRRGETVTVLNDACLFAPGALVDLPIRWRQVDDRRVEAAWTHGPHEVRALLFFDESGALVDFQSDDRPALAEDGRTLLPQRWSTPIGGYRAMGPFRLASRGEGRYAAAGGEYAYIEIEVEEVTTDILSSQGGGR
ncbi:hypothetical protein KBD49_09690 [Myxococcota bacterium]|nr:hypothetical protein [Myxococcota bacterium]